MVKKNFKPSTSWTSWKVALWKSLHVLSFFLSFSLLPILNGLEHFLFNSLDNQIMGMRCVSVYICFSTARSHQSLTYRDRRRKFHHFVGGGGPSLKCRAIYFTFIIQAHKKNRININISKRAIKVKSKDAKKIAWMRKKKLP